MGVIHLYALHPLRVKSSLGVAFWGRKWGIKFIQALHAPPFAIKARKRGKLGHTTDRTLIEERLAAVGWLGIFMHGRVVM